LPGVSNTSTSAVPPWEQQPPRHMAPPDAGVEFDRSVLGSERCPPASELVSTELRN
jgi:hypothetical protein